MDSPISKDLSHSPFLREVFPQRIGRCSIRQMAGRSGREEAQAVQEIQYSPEERFVGTSVTKA